MRFPVTMLEFLEIFPDEAACWAHLRRTRWPRDFRCPRCDHECLCEVQERLFRTGLRRFPLETRCSSPQEHTYSRDSADTSGGSRPHNFRAEGHPLE